MADDEVLRRIDRHMERGNELMERGDELMERLRELFESNGTFMRELLLRHEKATDAMIERLQEGTRELREHRAEFRAHSEEFRAHKEEFREHREESREQRAEFRDWWRESVAEMRAQREALFRMLDKLDGGGQAAGA